MVSSRHAATIKKHGFVDSTGLKRLVAVDASHPPVTTTEPDAVAAVSRSSPQQPTMETWTTALPQQ